MIPKLSFFCDENTKYLVGRIVRIETISRGRSNIIFDAKLDDASHGKHVCLELEHARLDLARLPGSKLMVTAKIEQAGDSLRATDIESFGVEYCQLAA